MFALDVPVRFVWLTLFRYTLPGWKAVSTPSTGTTRVVSRITASWTRVWNGLLLKMSILAPARAINWVPSRGVIALAAVPDASMKIEPGAAYRFGRSRNSWSNSFFTTSTVPVPETTVSVKPSFFSASSTWFNCS